MTGGGMGALLSGGSLNNWGHVNESHAPHHHDTGLSVNSMVGVAGFEPTISCSQSRRATKLRYTP